MTESTTKTAAELAARINKTFGDGTVVTAKEMRSQVIPRITSGILSLDVALGGGWPVNQWSEVIGDESSGKTATVLKTIAANQALDDAWTVLWIAAEEFVPEYAEKIGCDLDRIVVVDTNIMEQAYEAVLEFSEARVVDCIVIDSLPALVPSEEGEKTMEDFQVGLAARLTGKFFRKTRKSGKRSLIVEDRPLTGFMVNQYRVKVGGWAPHGQEPTTTPGGRAKNYHYFVRAELRRSDWLGNGEKDPNTGSPIYTGQTIKYNMVKNKSAPPRGTATADFYFDGSFDHIKDLFNTALRLGVVERAGAYYKFGDHQWKGRTGAAVAVAEDETIQEAITAAIYNKVLREQGVSQPDDSVES